MDFKIVTDPMAVNQALFEVTHGLYIATANLGKPNGQCLDALMQVTNNPPQISFCMNKRSYTSEMVSATGIVAINVIDRDDDGKMDIIKRFGFQSGRNVDKFADFPFEPGVLGAPIIPGAKAFYECRVKPELSVDLGTHTLYIASIERAGVREQGEPFTYYEYRKIKMKK